MTARPMPDRPLGFGAHNTFEQGACLLELTAYLAGEDHNDEPLCVSGLLVRCGQRLNDSLLYDEQCYGFEGRLYSARSDLEPRIRALAPKLIGTASRPDTESKAVLVALDSLVREHAPMWLESVGLAEEAKALRESSEISQFGAVPLDAINRARDKVAELSRSAVETELTRHHNIVVDAGMAALSACSSVWPAVRDYGSPDDLHLVTVVHTLGEVVARDAAYVLASRALSEVPPDASRETYETAAVEALQPIVQRLQEAYVTTFERMVALWNQP